MTSENKTPCRLTADEFSPTPIEVTNAEFIKTVFASLRSSSGLGPDVQPLYVGFAGSPAGNGNWGAIKTPPENAGTNNYFTISAFKPSGGRYSRKKANFAAQCAVVLDDVTERVDHEKQKAQIPFDRITLAPSWALETSSGNFQIGFILSEPITAVADADALTESIIAAGLSDPGATGPATRLMRLPVGLNGKYTPPFTCALRMWEPARKYSVKELRQGLDLRSQSTLPEAPQEAKKTAITARREAPRHSDSQTSGNAVYAPAKAVNPVLEALQERGLIRRQIDKGKYEISCPWKSEHTDEVDSGAAYWEPDDNHPIGSFKCMHGHCAERHIDDLLKFLGLDAEDACLKARITTRPGEVNRIVLAAEEELAKTGKYFRRGGQVASIVRSKEKGGVRLLLATQQSLLIELCRLTRWLHYDGRSKCEVPCDPPTKYLLAILDDHEQTALPELIGISRQPVISSTGSICGVPGFNPDNGIYGDFDPSQFEIIEKPTKEDAERALEELEGFLEEFPFEAACDKSAALSAMLTAVVRPQLRIAPMYHVMAHVPGSGKSYLSSLIAVFATPDDPPASPFPKDDEECRKFLLSRFLEAPPLLNFDNLTEDIRAFKSLCIALTEPYMNGRILGSSKTANVSTRTLLLSSGNNVGPVQDMTRRVVTINLNPQDEIPANHVFHRPNLLDEARDKRGKLVSCALTIISAWRLAGCPKCQTVPSVNSFSQWSDWCRQPLLWLGRSDPAQRMFESMREDPERMYIGRIFAALRDEFHNSPFTVRMIAEHADQKYSGDLREALEEEFYQYGNLNRKRLGWWLKQKEGNQVDGYKLVKAPPFRKQLAYEIEVYEPTTAKEAATPNGNSN